MENKYKNKIIIIGTVIFALVLSTLLAPSIRGIITGTKSVGAEHADSVNDVIKKQSIVDSQELVVKQETEKLNTAKKELKLAIDNNKKLNSKLYGNKTIDTEFVSAVNNVEEIIKSDPTEEEWEHILSGNATTKEMEAFSDKLTK